MVDSVLSPVTVQLTDSTGTPVVGASLTVVPSAGAGVDVNTGAFATDSSGRVTFTPWVGRQPGPVTFQVTGSLTSVTVNATATAVDAGTLFTLVNATATSGYSNVPGAGPLATVRQPHGVAVASDGTVYFTTTSGYVLQLSPAGDVSVVAGNGVDSNSGDTGPATAASLATPYGLALDEAHQRLYLALYDRVRVVDLSTGIIYLFAGGGTTAGPTFGDNGPATSATMNEVTNIELGPDGDLYLGDSNRNAIRRVDPTTGSITTWVAGVSGTPPAPSITGCNATCSVVWDGHGNAFIGAYINPGSGNNYYGVVRTDLDGGNSVAVAGATPGATGELIESTTAQFQSAPWLALDSAGNLFTSDATDNRLRRIEGGSLRISTIAGNGTAGFSGDHGSATLGEISAPGQMVMSGTDLYFADANNNALRIVNGVGTNVATPAILTVGSGDGGSSTFIDDLTTAMVAKLTDSNAVALSAWNLTWSVIDPGGYLFTSNVATNFTGKASNSGRVGLAPGNYHYEVAFSDLHGLPATNSPLVFTVTAIAPDAGTLFTPVDTDFAGGFTGVPGVATVAHMATPRGVATASDGSVYFSSGSFYVLKLSTAGVLSVIAGNGTNSNSGDNGPATAASIATPYSLALDEVNNLLFIALYDRVRVIDLSTGTIYPYAGGGTAGSPGYGDNGPASAATMNEVTNIEVGPDGFLYLGDSNRNAIRRIDPSSGIITTWLASVSGSPASPGITGCNTTCSMAWDGSGHAYIGAYLNPGPAGDFYGVLRTDLTGANTSVVAGEVGGGNANGVAATTAAFGFAPYVTFSPAGATGTLVLAVSTDHWVREVDLSSGLITTVAGTGTVGTTGDYDLATQGELSAPAAAMVSTTGHLLIADTNASAIREVW